MPLGPGIFDEVYDIIKHTQDEVVKKIINYIDKRIEEEKEKFLALAKGEKLSKSMLDKKLDSISITLPSEYDKHYCSIETALEQTYLGCGWGTVSILSPKENTTTKAWSICLSKTDELGEE